MQRPPKRDKAAPVLAEEGFDGIEPTSAITEQDVSDTAVRPFQDQQSQSSADIAIITALPEPERAQVLKVFGTSWQTEIRQGVAYRVTSFSAGTQSLKLVVCCQTEMGMVPATILTMKTLLAWTPKLLVMTGVCAGVQGTVEHGDIIVGQQLFDYGSGKLKDGKLYPDYSPIPADTELCSLISNFADRATGRVIGDAWPIETGCPKRDLVIHLGALASGAAVVADEGIVNGIKEHKRKLHGLEMEAYGVGKAVLDAGRGKTKLLVIKSVMDFADTTKGDEFKEFCSFASAKLLALLLEAHADDIFS